MHHLLPLTAIIAIAIEQTSASFIFGSKKTACAGEEDNFPPEPETPDFEKWVSYSDKLLHKTICDNPYPGHIKAIISKLKVLGSLQTVKDFAAALTSFENDLAALKAVLKWRDPKRKMDFKSATPQQAMKLKAEIEKQKKVIQAGKSLQMCEWYKGVEEELSKASNQALAHMTKLRRNFVVTFLQWNRVVKDDRGSPPNNQLYLSNLEEVRGYCAANEYDEVVVCDANFVSAEDLYKAPIDDNVRNTSGTRYTNLQKAIDALLIVSTGKEAARLRAYKRTMALQALSLFASSYVIWDACNKKRSKKKTMNAKWYQTEFLKYVQLVLEREKSSDAVFAYEEYQKALKTKADVKNGKPDSCASMDQYKLLAVSLRDHMFEIGGIINRRKVFIRNAIFYITEDFEALTIKGKVTRN